jgi:uncharacterized membrane protein YqhA
MLGFILSLRFVMLIASLGALAGSFMMFWLGGVKLAGALGLALRTDALAAREMTAAVMGATDALLFGIVLVIFAYAVAFGFVLDASGESRDRLPAWMRVDGVAELKHTLVQVILVYLIVDFATDLAEGDAPLSWETLVMPLSIALIAGAVRLMGGGHRAAADPPHARSHR